MINLLTYSHDLLKGERDSGEASPLIDLFEGLSDKPELANNCAAARLPNEPFLGVC